MCVAKLHDINAELVEDRGFLDALKASPYQLPKSCQKQLALLPAALSLWW